MKRTEIGLIPNDWEIINLGDVFEFKNGLNKAKNFFGFGTPIINYTDVYKNRGLLKENVKGKVYLNSDEINRFETKKGDVFFTRTSETPEEVGISSVLLDNIDNCVFSGFILRARPKKKIFTLDFCKYCFSTKEVRDAIIKSCTYTTRALTNGSLLSKISIPLPPIEEQKRIAQALSDVDAVISTTEKLIAKKKALKQGAMQTLLSGKIRLGKFGIQNSDFRSSVSKNNSVHHCEELSDVAIHNGFKMTELGLIPEDWQVKRLGDEVILSTETFESAQYKKEYYVGTENMLQDKAGITKNETVNPIGKAKGFKRNDILMSNIRPYLKKIWYANRDGICSNDVLVYRVAKNAIDSSFLYSILSDDKFFAYVMENAVGTKMPRGDKKIIREYLFACPPTKEEQTAIAIVLSDMDTEIATLETKLAKYRQLKTGMMQQLLTGKIRLV